MGTLVLKATRRDKRVRRASVAQRGIFRSRHRWSPCASPSVLAAMLLRPGKDARGCGRGNVSLARQHLRRRIGCATPNLSGWDSDCWNIARWRREG